MAVDETNKDSGLVIEPSIAKRDAITYLDRMIASDIHDRSEHSAAALNDCSGVIAYTAYLSGLMQRGRVEECRQVLMGLLGKIVNRS